MHAGLQLDVEAECDSKTRPCDVVTRRGGDLKVLGFDSSSRRFDWSPELPGQNVSSRDAVLEIIFEVFGQDPSPRIDDVHTWIRNAIGRCAQLRFFIEDVISPDDLRVRIGE